MKQSRILIGLFAAFALSFGFMVAGSGMAFAQEADLSLTASASGDTVSDLQTQATSYRVWVKGKQVTSANKGNVLGDKKKSVKYNPSTRTLTLKNANIKGGRTWATSNNAEYRSVVEVRGGGVTIVLKGKNVITGTGKASAGSYGICVLGESGAANVLIKGSGSLKVTAGSAGLYSNGIYCNNLNIEGSAKVTTKGGSMIKTSYKAGSTAGSIGVYNTGFLALGGSAKLIATGKTCAILNAATFSQDYTPQVKAGASAKKIKVNKRNPASSVYTKYKYVSISKATSSSSSSTSSKTPAKTSIISIDTSKSGQATINWRTVSKNCTGYEIQISTTSSFDSSKGYVYNKRYYSGYANLSNSTYTLTPAGIWYFRVRPLNHINDSKEYKGAWSAYVSAYVGSNAAG